ncbi:MAG TPA: hypothetical protein VGE52_06555, partial [Pirellulales bacterium]
AMSLADKLSILEKIAAAQCEAYGFEGPPKIRLLNLGASGAAGYFRSGEKDIVLNSDSGSPIHHDFKEILDTILHENMHVYQHQLVHGVAELEEDDPRQTQVDLFSINDAAEGYCDPNEDGIAYKMQPQEAHAYLTGETATQAILAKLPPA